MAWFLCNVGNGGLELVVTCASSFSGSTISCTDGNTTLTGLCPSSSPYEVTFNLPNKGTWTVSGVVSGVTYTESVLIDEFDCELKDYIELSVDFYSAANDTVSYIGAIDGQAHTITTDNSGHASAIIAIPVNGATITFSSSVAKDPYNLSNDYSKAISVTSATTDIYLMPVDNALYWYGYISSDLEDCMPDNGWSLGWANQSLWQPVKNTNNIFLEGKYYGVSGVGTTSPIASANKLYVIANGVTLGTDTVYGGLCGANGKQFVSGGAEVVTPYGTITTTSIMKAEVDASGASNFYVRISSYSSSSNVHALWYD